MQQQKKRGRPPKLAQAEFAEQVNEQAPPVVEAEPEFCTVLVMHRTNIVLEDFGLNPPEVRKIPFRGKAIIPFKEYERICEGDDAAGRGRRLEKIS